MEPHWDLWIRFLKLYRLGVQGYVPGLGKMPFYNFAKKRYHIWLKYRFYCKGIDIYGIMGNNIITLIK